MTPSLEAGAELVGCPFCGEQATLERDYHGVGFCGACLPCDFSLGFKPTVEEAVQAWNNRPALLAYQAEIEAKDQVLEALLAAWESDTISLNRDVVHSIRAALKGASDV